MQIVSSIDYFISISYKTPKFHVFVDYLEAWTLKLKMKEKWRKRVEDAKVRIAKHTW